MKYVSKDIDDKPGSMIILYLVIIIYFIYTYYFIHTSTVEIVLKLWLVNNPV